MVPILSVSSMQKIRMPIIRLRTVIFIITRRVYLILMKGEDQLEKGEDY